MPKNAVQRLQKIDNDIKTVLSIYDIVNTSQEKNGESQTQKAREALHFSKISPSKCWETDLLFEKLHEPSARSPSRLFDSLKQIGSLIPEPERSHPRKPVTAKKRFPPPKKPNSAPSSSSTLSTICESDYKWQQSSESLAGFAEKSVSLRTIVSDGIHVLDWIDSNEFAEESDRFLTPSKTILTANEILTQNNYPTDKENTTEGENLTESHDEVPFALGNITSGDENAPSEDKPKVIPLKKVHSPPARLHQFEYLLPAKAFGTKVCRNIQKDKTFPESPQVSVVHKKTSKPQKPDGSEFKMRTKLRENHLGVKKEMNSTGEKQEKKSRNAYEKERRAQSPKNSDAQKIRKSLEVQGPDLRTKQLSKILEKSNEKLEKMKMSKELALDIAKQLKDKYDEIQQSREGLMEKLQNVEKDNERLNKEVKNVQDSKVKLELTMEELKDSKTKLQEQELRAKKLLAENAWLKIKITELEKQHSEKLIEKQNKIDHLQKERLSEIRKEMKHREHRVEDVQRLVKEKTELALKIEDLRSTLKERQTTLESQELKIRQLEGEVLRQKQYLKKKTERLEETNNELESIKNKSSDLEEQVKTLRTNIENFDQMHKNLMKQMVEYEEQIKLKEEENQTLQNDNLRLKSELENDKDALLIKTKIIENQQETIKQMRDKAEDAKALLKRNQSLERVLNVERDEKLELQEAVERLKWRKEELKNRIKSLESDLLLAPQEVVRDLQKTQMVLHELENQVQIKQKEWELHLQALIREKEQACSVAEFATKKLMQTTTEFQKQSEAHKRLHRVLAENLAEKERHLREFNEKVSSQAW